MQRILFRGNLMLWFGMIRGGNGFMLLLYVGFGYSLGYFLGFFDCFAESRPYVIPSDIEGEIFDGDYFPRFDLVS